MSARSFIIVVDDVAIIRESVVEFLRREGYDAEAAENGAALRAITARRRPDLAIVDLKMPGDDGFTLTRYLRESFDCGVIMLTSKSDKTDCIVALEMGADHFVSKPHDPRDLLARVRSLLRRAQPKEAAPSETDRDCGGWQFDRDARAVIGPGGSRAELTGAEFNLLGELVEKPGRVLTREHLLQIVYDRPWDYFDRSIDVLVTRLRRKLESAGIESAQIRSIRGAGYTFTRRAADRPVENARALAS